MCNGVRFILTHLPRTLSPHSYHLQAECAWKQHEALVEAYLLSIYLTSLPSPFQSCRHPLVPRHRTCVSRIHDGFQFSRFPSLGDLKSADIIPSLGSPFYYPAPDCCIPSLELRSFCGIHTKNVSFGDPSVKRLVCRSSVLMP